jgi:hypothetical protein
MKVSVVLTLLFVFSPSLAAQDPPAPVITVRKGVSIIADVKDVTGAAGSSAVAVLKNDIQLSGALTLGDANSATITVSGIASTGAFSGKSDRQKWQPNSSESVPG